MYRCPVLTLNQWVLGSSPRWCTKKSRNDVAAFLLHHSLRDGFMLRLRLAFSSRGLVAKNAPLGHFLDAPTDGAPKNALHESVGHFCIALFQRRLNLVHHRGYSNSAAFLSPRESPRRRGGHGKARRWGMSGAWKYGE